ncbi:hypothetical protein D1AOALGA4SA_10561 [Olavius algarvensis Delta 1 endosymbiont]|nr:hypothetical protein D1AOALGA4SA_10561 [Olavius algarvensis Delta 1 endosymbiont]
MIRLAVFLARGRALMKLRLKRTAECRRVESLCSVFLIR